MAPGPGGNGDFLPQYAGFVKKRGILFLHAHGRAAAPDVPGKPQQLLHRHQLHILVPGGSGGLLEVQLAAHGDAEHVDAGFLTPGDQGLKNLLGRHTDGLGGVGAAEIGFVKFIKLFPAGDSRLLHKAHGVCFRCHIITGHYYTTKRTLLQEGIIQR